VLRPGSCLYGRVLRYSRCMYAVDMLYISPLSALQERHIIRAALLREVVRVQRQLQASAKGVASPAQMKVLQEWETAYAQVGT
jgi:hypothetical protein